MIKTPLSYATVDEGSALALEAIALDNEDGDLSRRVVWVSSLDGAVTSPAVLSVGQHRLTATVRDSGGLSASDSVNVTVKAKAVNTKPRIVIKRPASDITIDEGSRLTLRARARDKEDGRLNAKVRWRSSIDGAIPRRPRLSVGQHLITASVTDSGGLTATDTVVVTVKRVVVNTKPSIVIESPVTHLTVDEGDAVTLSARATDTEDGNLSAQVSWMSSLDGAIASPAVLSVGQHTLTATVRDSEGLTATDSVTVTVEKAIVNTEPTVSIIAPLANASFESGTAIALQGAAHDEQDGDLSAQMVWVSSIDGVLNSPAMLSEGDHQITLRVTDSGGLSASDTVNITVTAPYINTPPVVNISAPINYTSVEEGTSLLFKALAMDEEDGDISRHVNWYSSLDGAIADLTTLSVGDHVITANVTDSEGLVGEDSIMVKVTAAVVDTTKPMVISWSAPTSRSNGEPLYPEDLVGYEISITNHQTGETMVVDLADGLATTYETEPLEEGSYSISLRAYDVDGLYSDWTAPVTGHVSM